MGEESNVPDAIHPRRRFQIADVLAVVAAFAIAFGLVRVLFERGYFRLYDRLHSTRSLVMPEVKPGIMDAMPQILVFAIVFAAAFVHPIAVSMHFALRRRRGDFHWRDFVGMAPGAVIAVVFLPKVSTVPHGIFVLVSLSLGLIIAANTAAGMQLLALWESSKRTWCWTDWYGCAVAILFGVAVLFGVAGA